jgi:hypothetical protein
MEWNVDILLYGAVNLVYRKQCIPNLHKIPHYIRLRLLKFKFKGGGGHGRDALCTTLYSLAS